jgi:hypothetical protein
LQIIDSHASLSKNHPSSVAIHQDFELFKSTLMAMEVGNCGGFKWFQLILFVQSFKRSSKE